MFFYLRDCLTFSISPLTYNVHGGFGDLDVIGSSEYLLIAEGSVGGSAGQKIFLALV